MKPLLASAWLLCVVSGHALTYTYEGLISNATAHRIGDTALIVNDGDAFSLQISVHPEQATIFDASRPIITFILTVDGLQFYSYPFEFSGTFTGDTNGSFQAFSMQEAQGIYANPHLSAICSLSDSGGYVSIGYPQNGFALATGGFSAAFAPIAVAAADVPDGGSTLALALVGLTLLPRRLRSRPA